MPPSFLVDERGRLVDSYGGADVAPQDEEPAAVDAAAGSRWTTSCGRWCRRRCTASLARPTPWPTTTCACRGSASPCSLVAEPISDARGIALARAALVHPLRRAAPGAGRGGAAPSRRPPRPRPARRRATAPATSRPSPARTCTRCATSSPTRRRTCRPRSRSSRRPTRSSRPPTRSWSPRTRSCRAPTRSCTRSTRSCTRSTPSTRRRSPSCMQLNGDIDHLLNEHRRRHHLPRSRPVHPQVHAAHRPRCSTSCRRTSAARCAASRTASSRDGLMDDIAHALRRGHDGRGADLGSRRHAATSCASCRIASRAAEDSTPPDGVVVTLTDISPLEQARARVAQLSAIVESSEDAIIGTALNGSVTSWNDGARRLFGYSADEVTGRHLMRLLPHGQQDAFDAVVADPGRDRRAACGRPRACARTARRSTSRSRSRRC